MRFVDYGRQELQIFLRTGIVPLANGVPVEGKQKVERPIGQRNRRPIKLQVK
jgi:hypothetical protein